MYTPYLLIMTMFSGAGEIVDPKLHNTLASCEAEIQVMKETVEREWAMHGILRMHGECRDATMAPNTEATGVVKFNKDRKAGKVNVAEGPE